MKPDSHLLEGEFRLLEVDNRLILPLHITIKAIITSLDVLHSFAVPALGIKIDASPGRLNVFNVEMIRSGIYYGQCSELCGINHGFMPIVLEIGQSRHFLSKLKKELNDLYVNNLFILQLAICQFNSFSQDLNDGSQTWYEAVYQKTILVKKQTKCFSSSNVISIDFFSKEQEAIKCFLYLKTCL
jgi:hypothetical protein